MKNHVKMILVFACVITLLPTTGCLVVGHGHGHRHWRGHGPVVPVPAPMPVPVPVPVPR